MSNDETIEKKHSISERAELLRLGSKGSNSNKKTSFSSKNSNDYIKIPPGFERSLLVDNGPKFQFYSKINDLKKKFIEPNQQITNNTNTIPEPIKKYSAGVLPFAVKNTTVYFLLGRDLPRDTNTGPWSDFGGRSEISDNGRWDYTASREFYEETIGSIMDINTIMSKMSNKKNFIKIKSTTLNGFPYYMYLIKIPYKDYRQNFQSTLSFMKYISGTPENPSTISYKYFEKSDIQWISLDTVMESAHNDDSLYPLRPVFKKTLALNSEVVKDFCNIAMRTNVFDDVS